MLTSNRRALSVKFNFYQDLEKTILYKLEKLIKTYAKISAKKFLRRKAFFHIKLRRSRPGVIKPASFYCVTEF